MSLMHQMNEWSSRHHPKWLVVLRVVLGLSLFFKGFGFIQNNVELTSFFSATSYFGKATWLNTIIPWIHLLGGSMIIVGLFTRFWSLVTNSHSFGCYIFCKCNNRCFCRRIKPHVSYNHFDTPGFLFIEGEVLSPSITILETTKKLTGRINQPGSIFRKPKYSIILNSSLPRSICFFYSEV